MQKKLYTLLFGAFSLVLASGIVPLQQVFSQATIVLSSKQVPQSTTTLKDFAPKGWQIEQSLNADLNGDGFADVALVLVETFVGKPDPNNLPERQRALVLALKQGNRYQRVGFGPYALICTRCGGAFWGIGEVPVNLKVQKKVLLVSFESGSNEMTAQTYRYRLSGSRVQLIGVDSNNYSRTTGAFSNTSSNYLTGDRVLEQGSSNSNGESTVKSTKKSRFNVRPIYLEDVRFEEYY
jgi:hypothetical protein